MSKSIFLSYCWSDKDVTKKLDNDLRALGFVVTIDERDLVYKANLHEFMESMKNHDYTIVVVSDFYLKSYNCLYEIGSLMSDVEYRKKTLQIILPSAKIFKKSDKYDYFNYWDSEIVTLTDKLKTALSPDNISLIKADLTETQKIRQNLPQFIEFLNSEKALTLSEIENGGYEYLLDYTNSKKEKENNSFLFSKKNNIVLPLEDFRRHIGENFKGTIKQSYNYGFFVRIYLKNGYREGLLHRKKFEPIYDFNRVKSIFPIGLEIDVIIQDINFDNLEKNEGGGLVLTVGNIHSKIEDRINIDLINLKNGNPKNVDISGLNLNEIPLRLLELKSVEQINISGNNYSEQVIYRLFSRYFPNLHFVFFNEYVYINDEENDKIVKIKYKK